MKLRNTILYLAQACSTLTAVPKTSKHEQKHFVCIIWNILQSCDRITNVILQSCRALTDVHAWLVTMRMLTVLTHMKMWCSDLWSCVSWTGLMLFLLWALQPAERKHAASLLHRKHPLTFYLPKVHSHFCDFCSCALMSSVVFSAALLFFPPRFLLFMPKGDYFVVQSVGLTVKYR